MLRTFRNSFQHLKWALWLVIIAFVIGLGYVGGTGQQTGATAVASVGGVDISLRDYRTEYQGLEQRARSLYGEAFTAELSQQLGIAEQALERVINAELLRQEALRMGLEATDSEIQRIILQDPTFQDADGNFIGAEAYEALLTDNRLTPSDIENGLREQLNRQKLFQVLGQTLYVSDAEVEKAFRDQVERAALRYITVPKERFADQVIVDDEELLPFYENNRPNYNLPEQRRVNYVLIQPRLIEQTLEVPEEDLRAYYDSNTDEFTLEEQVRARHILLKASGDEAVAQARATLESVRRRLEAGEDFATLARELSQDDASRDLGGELGFFTRGRYNPALEDAAFGGAPGSIVGPVETDLITQTGLHLIEIQERRDGGQQPFETVSPGIHARLLAERSALRAEELAQEVADLGNPTGAALQAWAEAQPGATWETPAAFGREDNVPGIGRGTEFTTTVFELETGKTSEPVSVIGGWAVARLEEISASRIQELDEVREQVRNDVRARKLGEVASQELAAVLTEIQGGLDAEEAAERLAVEFDETDEFNRSGFIPGMGLETALSEAAFELSAGDWGGPIETARGHVLFQVVSRIGFDPLAFLEEKQATREGLIQQKTEELLSSILAERRTELGVVRNTTLLESTGLFQPIADS